MLHTKRTIQCHVIDYLSRVKVKFGVRRERVPFVLACDFEIIIDKEERSHTVKLVRTQIHFLNYH